MLIKNIWDFFVLALCPIAVAVAVIINRRSPKRSLNRFLGLFLVLIASGQVLQLIAFNFGGLIFLRIANVLGNLGIVTAGLIHDAVLHPTSTPLARIKRSAVFLVPALIVTAIPLTNFWIPFFTPFSRSYPVHGALFFYYLGLRAALAGWIVVMAFKSRRLVPKSRRFDAYSFITLALFLFTLMILVLIARVSSHREAVRWIEAFVGVYYPFAAWMMTSPRLYRIREFARVGIEILIGLSLPLAAILLMLHLADSIPTIWLAAALATAAYPLALLGNNLAGRTLHRLSDKERQNTKAAVATLVSNEWSETVLQDTFCAIVSTFMGGADVECTTLDSLTENRLQPVRSLLVSEAARKGWLTTRSIERSADVKKMEALHQAFSDENLLLILVSESRGNYCVLFISQVSSLKIATHPIIAFLSELLSMYQNGRERIFLARKAVHNDRLATLGFIASQVSHDARNRLDSIRAALDLLKQRQEEQLTMEHRELLLQELDTFLIDFNISLDMARIDAARIITCSVRTIIEDVVRVFRPYASSYGVLIEISFNHECGPIAADRRLLRQTLFNLLRNAAEALKLTRAPRILIRTSSSRPNKMHLDVQDNGPGVPLEAYDRLFSEFNTTKEAGTGLGLSLCRTAMAMMNGSVQYLTPKGQEHACFRLDIPVAEEPLLDNVSTFTVSVI